MNADLDLAGLERLRQYAREASIALIRLSGGGSEMFKTVADEPYADPELCIQRAEERIDTIRRLHERRAAALTKDAPHVR